MWHFHTILLILFFNFQLVLGKQMSFHCIENYSYYQDTRTPEEQWRAVLRGDQVGGSVPDDIKKIHVNTLKVLC